MKLQVLISFVAEKDLSILILFFHNLNGLLKINNRRLNYGMDMMQQLLAMMKLPELKH